MRTQSCCQQPLLGTRGDLEGFDQPCPPVEQTRRKAEEANVD